jgi:hypothetical protein
LPSVAIVRRERRGFSGFFRFERLESLALSGIRSESGRIEPSRFEPLPHKRRACRAGFDKIHMAVTSGRVPVEQRGGACGAPLKQDEFR